MTKYIQFQEGNGDIHMIPIKEAMPKTPPKSGFKWTQGKSGWYQVKTEQPVPKANIDTELDKRLNLAVTKKKLMDANTHLKELEEEEEDIKKYTIGGMQETELNEIDNKIKAQQAKIKNYQISITHRQKDIENVYGKESLTLKKGDVPDSEFDPEQLAKGIKVELEHTDDKEVAKQITKAHLSENPKYYDYLDEMEKEMPKNEQMGIGVIRQKVKDFLRQNPNPEDSEVHTWAEEQGYDIDDIEMIMYELATAHIM